MEPPKAAEFFEKRTTEMPVCTVCLEPCAAGLGAVPCGHVFHAACVEDWVRRKHRCPNCRRPVRDAKVLALQFQVEGGLTRAPRGLLAPLRGPAGRPRGRAPRAGAGGPHKQENRRLKEAQTGLFKRARDSELRLEKAERDAAALQSALAEARLQLAQQGERRAAAEAAQGALEEARARADAKLGALETELAALKAGLRRLNKFKVVG